MQFEKMEELWLFTCMQVPNPPHGINAFANNVEKVFEWLRSAYTEPHRHYHTFDHIFHCLERHREWVKQPLPEGSRQPSFDESFAVILAIWFHDSVYNTQASDNEEQSKKLCDNACGVLGLSKDIAEHAGELILQTKTHCIENPNLWGGFAFNDIDLSILGEDEAIFDKFEEDIRKEYEWVPLEDYKAGRKDLLEKFSKRPCIYLTDYFSPIYETRARQNIARSLTKL